MTKEDVTEALKVLGVNNLYSFRLEVRALPQILHMDERLYGITSGVYEGRRWLAAVTGKNLYLISVNPLSKTEVKLIKLSSIRNVSVNKGLMFAKITLEHNEGVITLEHAAKASVPTFVRAVQHPLKN